MSCVLNRSFCLSAMAVKLIIPWVDVQKLERTSNLFMTDIIRITTQSKERDFSMFLNIDEAFRIMEQLADVTLRRLLDNEVFELDPGLQDPTQITKRYTVKFVLIEGQKSSSVNFYTVLTFCLIAMTK